jgi:hypothetical protein
MAARLWMPLQVLDGTIGDVAQGSHDGVPTVPQTGQESVTTPPSAAVTIRSSKLQISVQSSLYIKYADAFAMGLAVDTVNAQNL